MGWAKYYEDNVEIMYERKSAIPFYRQETEKRVVCTGLLPVANILVEIKEEVTVSQQILYKDKYIVCKDCGRKFLFSAKSQKYFGRMAWNPPKRCKCCRNYRNTRYLMCSSY